MKEPKYSSFDLNDVPVRSTDELLDEVLKTDSMVPLPPGFADRVAGIAIRRMSLRQSLREFLTYAAALLLAGLIFGLVFYLTNPEVWNRWGSFLLSKIYLLAGTSLLVCFIFFADRVLFPWLFFSATKARRPKRNTKWSVPFVIS